MVCEACFKDWVSKCLPYDSSITIHSPLGVGTYRAEVTDKFDHKYSTTFIIYDQGYFELDLVDFPEEFFNEHAGAVTVEVFKGCEKILIPMKVEDGTEHYDCLEIEVKGGTMDKSTIGCEI